VKRGPDQIEALSPEREALWTRLEKASFLTDDEKRSAAGYGPKPLTKFNPNHDPSNGQFTSGPGGGSGLTPIAYRPRPPQPPKPPAPATAATPPTVKPVAPKPDFLSKKPGSGKITGNVDKLTPAEKAFANEMRDLGNDIEIVPTGEGRTPDFKINGQLHELKTVSGIQKTDNDGLSSAISSRIMDGRGQSGHIIVDARSQVGMTTDAADRAIVRAYGTDNRLGSKIESITILTPAGSVSAPRRK